MCLRVREQSVRGFYIWHRVKGATWLHRVKEYSVTFKQFSLDPRIGAGIDAVGYATPTPVQQQAIPVVLKGRDPQLNRLVAIKVPVPEPALSTAARKRFLREAQAAAAISRRHCRISPG